MSVTLTSKSSKHALKKQKGYKASLWAALEAYGRKTEMKYGTRLHEPSEELARLNLKSDEIGKKWDGTASQFGPFSHSLDTSKLQTQLFEPSLNPKSNIKIKKCDPPEQTQVETRTVPKAAAKHRVNELEGIQEETSIVGRNPSSANQSRQREVENSGSNVLIKDERPGVSDAPTTPPIEDEIKKPITLAAVAQPASHSKKLESAPKPAGASPPQRRFGADEDPPPTEEGDSEFEYESYEEEMEQPLGGTHDRLQNEIA